jgi:hypothetical protein
MQVRHDSTSLDADEPQSVSLSPKHRGYKRIVGELNGLGISVCATSVRKVLLAEGLQAAPERSHSSWGAFLRARIRAEFPLRR